MSKEDLVKPNKLEEAIDRVFVSMTDVECDTEEYSALLDRLSTLYKMKEIEAKNKALEPSRRVSADTMVTVAGSLLGILMIIGHERANVIGTKALGLVMKLR